MPIVLILILLIALILGIIISKKPKSIPENLNDISPLIHFNPENKVDEVFVDELGIRYKIKKSKEKVERRTYLVGDFTGKYWGTSYKEGIIFNSDLKHFSFKIYEGQIFIADQTIQFSITPVEFNNPQIIPKENLPDKYFLEIKSGEQSSYYEIDLLDVKFYHFHFSPELHQTESSEVFGTIKSQISGFIQDFKIVDKEERVYFDNPSDKYILLLTDIPTGKIEKKNGYYRKEFLLSDHVSVGWGAWINEYSLELKQSGQKPSKNKTSFLSGCLSLVGSTVLLCLFWVGIISIFSNIPNFLLVLAFFLLIFLLRRLLIRFAQYIVLILYLVFIYFLLINNKPSTHVSTKRHRRNDKREIVTTPYKSTSNDLNVDDSSVAETVVKDSTIYRFRSWTDLSGKIYEGTYSLKLNDYYNSQLFKNNLVINSNVNNPYDFVLYNLFKNDSTKLEGLYNMLDSIKLKNNLDREHFAEVIMCLIQDIKYYSILPLGCDPSLYDDEFIKNYLSADSSNCDPYQKFGINSPVEFLMTLRGDCDTRTLLLFSIYSHYNYDVVVLSSDVYHHSIIGINLNYSGYNYAYNNTKYYLWESTSIENYPGVIDPSISNTSYWRISLKSITYATLHS